jgi:hypothetical protein
VLQNKYKCKHKQGIMTLIQVVVIICLFVSILCLIGTGCSCAGNLMVENMTEVQLHIRCKTMFENQIFHFVTNVLAVIIFDCLIH